MRQIQELLTAIWNVEGVKNALMFTEIVEWLFISILIPRKRNTLFFIPIRRWNGQLV